MKKLIWLAPLALFGVQVMAQPALRLKTKQAAESQPGVHQNTRTPGRSHWLVQFRSAPGDDQLNGLAGHGATVLSYIPDRALSVTAADNITWDGLDVQWAGQLQPQEKISPALANALAGGVPGAAVVESYSDVDPNDVRAIANQAGVVIRDNPDLLGNHLLIWGDAAQMLALAGWDEIAYIFPASADLSAGTPLHACAGALTSLGPVGQSVALIDDGWDGPDQGSADLKYSFVRLTEKLPVDSTQAEIARALGEWSKYVQVTFTPSTVAAANRTLAILFASGDHGDGYPFDGPGGVQAHTFYPFPTNPEPIAGDMHFDNDESWKIGVDVDVFSLALHEAGHALGLGHSDNPNAVMYPYYRMHASLEADDIAAIRQLYAARDVSQPVAPGAPAPPQPAPTNPLLLVVQVPQPTTSSASIAVSGAVSGGSGPVTLLWSTNQAFSGTAQASPTWTIPAIPLNLGANAITVTARDGQQNQVSQTISVTRQQASAPPPPPTPPPAGPDTTPPSLTILSPAAATVSTSANAIVVSGSAADNVGVAKITWTSSTGGSGVASGTTKWSTPPIPLYVGATTIVIHAADAAGNTSWRSLVVTRN